MRLIKSVLDLRKFNNVDSIYHRQAGSIIDHLTKDLDIESVKNIPSNTKMKLQWYMAECIYSCEKFNALTGQRSTPNQRKSYMLAGALGAMCDFIIDDIELKTEEIKKFKKPLKEAQCSNMVEKLYAIIFHSFINTLGADNKTKVLYYYNLLFDAQLSSKKQSKINISRAEVDKVCEEKGGYSLLFLRALVNGEISEIEEKAWYELGAYIQYCNDAQDLYKDLRKGIKTFASTRADLESIAKDLDQQKKMAFSLIKETDFDEKQKDYFLFTLHLMGIGILAKLNRYLKICDHNFSKEKLAMKSKEEIRSQLLLSKLLSYSFPRVVKYDYKTVEKSYNFDLKLKNKL